MAEQLVRLYGPAQVLGTIASPTTLFTVPPKETYLVRALHVLSQPVTGTSGTTIGSVVVGKTNLSTGNLMFGVDVISQGAVYPSNIATVSLPFTENEVMAGGAAGIPTALSNYWDGTAAVEFTGTVDAASFATSSMTAAATVPFPSNVYMWMVNNKATTPDAPSVAVTTIGNSPITNIGTISTIATSTLRGTWLAGYEVARETTGTVLTVSFGGTQTNVIGGMLVISGTSLAGNATPSTSNVILQASTNSGTTETTQGVTQTPISSTSCQLLVVATTGVLSTYTGPAGSVEVIDTTQTSPSTTVAVYLMSPSQTNPSTTLALAGTSWVASCIEIGMGGGPMHLTVSGVKIKE